MLVGFYTFHSFSPIRVIPGQTRWFHVLALCVLVFLANRASISARRALPFMVLVGVTMLGALTAGLRSGFTEEMLWNGLGLGASLLGLLLLLPTLASARGRRWLLFALFACSLLWLSKLQTAVSDFGDDARLALSGRGKDRNFIAFMLVMGMVMLLGIALFWRRQRTLWLVWSIRLLALAGALGFLLALAYTFSRSGLLVGSFMIIVSLLAYTWKAKLRGLTLAVLVAGAIVGVASVAIPVILTQLPSWEMHFDRLVHWRTDDAMSGRRDLLEKGWLIVRENPVLGVGVGMSKPYVPAGASLRRKGGLIHNGYLTAWAELGMAGLVTALVLLGLWLAEMRARILEPCWRTVDFLCLVVAGTILAMNFFLDYPPIFWLCATLICGLHYQRRCRGESLKAAPARRAAGRSPKGMVAARFAGYPWLRASQHRAAALR